MHFSAWETRRRGQKYPSKQHLIAHGRGAAITALSYSTTWNHKVVNRQHRTSAKSVLAALYIRGWSLKEQYKSRLHTVPERKRRCQDFPGTISSPFFSLLFLSFLSSRHRQVSVPDFFRHRVVHWLLSSSFKRPSCDQVVKVITSERFVAEKKSIWGPFFLVLQVPTGKPSD